MKDVLIVHHNDLDGRCAAHIISKMCFDNKLDHSNFFETDYNKPFPIEEALKKEAVYILDFSIDPSTMARLLENNVPVVWIDHHGTAIDKYKDFDKKIPGLRSTKESGCVLSFVYAKLGEKNCHTMDDKTVDKLKDWLLIELPNYVKYIGDYDIWRFAHPESNDFYFGAMLHNSHPLSPVWENFQDDDFVNKVTNEGVIANKYKEMKANEYLKSWSFEVSLEGHKCLALNTPERGSGQFGKLLSQYDIVIPFTFNGKNWSYSLYSEKGINVGEVAKKYGGGGHPGAAGFVSDKLIFEGAK